MKQVLKSTKRKYLVGGIAAFAGIALLTTGVATWVIGANSTAQQNVTVTVDGKQNNSASIEIGGVDSPLKIGEQADVNTGFVQVTGAAAGNMKVTLTDVKYSYSSSFSSTGVAIKFSINYDYDSSTHTPKANSGNLVSASASKMSDRADSLKDAKLKDNDENNTAWQYIAAPVNATGLETGADTIHTITSLEIEFKWGSFFGGEAPSTFYNGLSLSTVADAKNVEDELNEMEKALTSIKLTAELVKA